VASWLGIITFVVQWFYHGNGDCSFLSCSLPITVIDRQLTSQNWPVKISGHYSGSRNVIYANWSVSGYIYRLVKNQKPAVSNYTID